MAHQRCPCKGSCALVFEYGIPTMERAEVTIVGPDGANVPFLVNPCISLQQKSVPEAPCACGQACRSSWFLGRFGLHCEQHQPRLFHSICKWNPHWSNESWEPWDHLASVQHIPLQLNACCVDLWAYHTQYPSRLASSSCSSSIITVLSSQFASCLLVRKTKILVEKVTMSILLSYPCPCPNYPWNWAMGGRLMIPDSTIFFTEDFAKWYLDIKRTSV